MCSFLQFPQVSTKTSSIQAPAEILCAEIGLHCSTERAKDFVYMARNSASTAASLALAKLCVLTLTPNGQSWSSLVHWKQEPSFSQCDSLKLRFPLGLSSSYVSSLPQVTDSHTVHVLFLAFAGTGRVSSLTTCQSSQVHTAI